jgi:uncharacterized heparinase superfamily protein
MTDLLRDHPAWPPMQRQLMRMMFATPLYSSTLLHRRPSQLSAAPPDPWPGSVEHGAAMCQGDYSFAGTTLHPEASPWDETTTNDAWVEALHTFVWLRNLRAFGGDNARKHARELTADWLTKHQRWSATVWRADIMGRRLVAWTSHYELFFASAPDPFRTQLLASMARQARHLSRTAAREADGLARLAAIKGLLFAGLCIPGEMPLLVRAAQLLEIELPRQVLADGGHPERSPALQLSLVRDLVDMRAALGASHQKIPSVLTNALERAVPMLRFFRHGDGGFALFNDSGEGDPTAIDLALAQASVRKRTPNHAPDSGFERLTAGKLMVLCDTGVPPRPGWDNHAHAGTLGLEVGFGKERLIVNCGPVIATGKAWRDAARATAAHSTLTIEDTNSSELGANSKRRVTRVHVDRQETDGNIWLSTSHNGYAGQFGLIHHRRLYMSANGDELRGEDSLTAIDRDGHGETTGNPENRAFAIRFHFHPAVKTSLVQDGGAVLLRLPGGTGWRLRVGSARIDMAESIYFGKGGAKRTQQVVLSGRTGGDSATVKWALRREGGRG